MSEDRFFIGWSAAPRRAVLFGAGALAVSAAGAAGLASWQGAPGDGRWNQGDVRDWEGDLVRAPYPMLRTVIEGRPRTAFLATAGKAGVQDRLGDLSGAVRVRASLIARGDHAMLAVVDGPEAFARTAAAISPPPVEEVLGETLRVGEILDAKCWFGAMRPGFGKTHKSCAALCARGGLPLAFCADRACVDGGDAPLFLDRAGRAHGPVIIPLVADPVTATGLLVRVGDILQFRVDRGDIRRL